MMSSSSCGGSLTHRGRSMISSFGSCIVPIGLMNSRMPSSAGTRGICCGSSRRPGRLSRVIDWLSFVAPLTHVEGSYSKVIQVRSQRTATGLPGVWISGNPAKWFQGHNIFGSSNIRGLVREMLERVCASVGITPTDQDRYQWQHGIIDMHRVDLTRSWLLAGGLPQVRSAIRSLDSTAHLAHRGRGHFKGDSLTFGKGSRRWSLTFYAKGSEIEVKGHELPEALRSSPLRDYAQGLLRGEVRMLRMQLEKLHLDYLLYWGDNPMEQHLHALQGLELSDAAMIESHVLEGLPGRLQLVYNSWREGHDLRAMLPARTFYRYRRELLAHGIDVAVKQERTSPDLSNVVPLRVVLHAEPAGIPDWAVGTPLYFEPALAA